jgi:hypothetical protein
MNLWIHPGWAGACLVYLVVVLAIASGLHGHGVSASRLAIVAYERLGYFILPGIASYMSYLALQQRILQIWRCCVPVGPFVVSLLVLADEGWRGLSGYSLNLVNIAASLSGIVLFYRLARANTGF